MNLREIEEQVAAIEPRPGVEFLEDLLLAYGFKKMSIARLMAGSTDKAETANERLLKGKVYFHATESDDEHLYTLIDSAREDARVLKHAPRFLIVKNERRLLASDQNTGETLDMAVEELSTRTDFFLPWVGIEKTQLENINYADVKAAEKMAKLYDAVTKHNHIETEADIHDLNVFFSRLLFCFFAEDTGVFALGSFTNTIGSYTEASGGDTHEFLDQLFEVLDRDLDDRDGVPEYLKRFGYVNGNLFARRCSSPRFSAKARTVILECGTLDWSRINPDIFGSMIQAVVHPSQREGLGMHYTSVENIMKVIRPLFLDELEEAFEKADTIKKLERLLTRIAEIQIFDPACGSGNFLVISYKELRKLEHRTLQRMIDLDPRGSGLFKTSALKLENFYGIEIDDFAHEIAILSLWLAKHQMNVEFKELFGAEIPLIPLRDSGNVVCGNAARVEWSTVCDPANSAETYVLGNPPYSGASVQGSAQKADFEEYFATSQFPRGLDYIALWFFRGADFLAQMPGARLAFVSTNSIVQGEQVALVWPTLLKAGLQVLFAYESFLWTNQARGRAGVSCVIVGLGQEAETRAKRLYTEASVREVENINPYLRPGKSDLIVHGRRAPLSGAPPMVFGSKPTDGGFLTLTSAEHKSMLESEPHAEPFLRRYMGATELIDGKERHCLWIHDAELTAAGHVVGIRQRLERVAAFRIRSSKAATRQLAGVPHRFAEIRHQDTAAIIVPIHSSERREYVPIGFVDGGTVISNAANAIYGAKPWLFGVIQSRMHMVWLRAVGGRLETRLRYSSELVYNTFPMTEPSHDAQEELADAGVSVLAAREHYSDRTLAELYKPTTMPMNLRKAHADLGRRDGPPLSR
jgi:hypothetical protein